MIAPHVWVRIAVLASLFIVLHIEILYRLVLSAAKDPDWSHAFLVPLISVYYIYLNRKRLGRMEATTSWWGLPIMLFGLAGYILSIYPLRVDMAKGYFMLIELFGLVWLMCGPRMMTILWFPIAYLAVGVKISARLWEMIAFKLQLLAARSSAVVLKMLGIDVEIWGTQIELYDGAEFIQKLEVAQACAGMRMLMAFVALAIAVAFLFRRPWWARLIIVAMALPIAVFVNVARVTVLGLLAMIDPALAKGDFHTMMGMVVMLVPALALLMLLGWVLDRIVVPAETGAGGGSVRKESAR